MPATERGLAAGAPLPDIDHHSQIIETVVLGFAGIGPLFPPTTVNSNYPLGTGCGGDSERILRLPNISNIPISPL
jgi:hypothetical protein